MMMSSRRPTHLSTPPSNYPLPPSIASSTSSSSLSSLIPNSRVRDPCGCIEGGDRKHRGDTHSHYSLYNKERERGKVLLSVMRKLSHNHPRFAEVFARFCQPRKQSNNMQRCKCASSPPRLRDKRLLFMSLLNSQREVTETERG